MDDEPLHKKEMLSSSDDFEAAYEAHAPSIYRFLFWRTRDASLSEDLTSSVFEKAWRSRSSFKGGSLAAWLHRIARNVLIDHWRKKSELPVEDVAALGVEAADSDIAETLDRELLASQLEAAIKKLPKDMRQVITLRFIQGLPSKAVATQLDISESNVRVIQYRALKKLKGYMQ